LIVIGFEGFMVAIGPTSKSEAICHARDMPRLTTPTYLFHHHQLKALWAKGSKQFSYLSPNDQLALHKYYLFALDKTELELVAHRRNVHSGDPSLPHRAGRAFAKLMRGERSKVGYSQMPNGRRISVRPLTRPTPDIELLAKALLQMAMREVEEREDKNQAA
jgi:hypothetical protein